MTAIVAITEHGKIWMGGDSCCTLGDAVEIQRDSKVRKRGEILIGTAGDGRWETITHHLADFPSVSGDLDRYVAVDICDAIRVVIKNTGEEMPNGVAIIGVRGRLYYVDSTLATWRPLDAYAAEGSGAVAALSALDAGIRGTPKHRIRRALEIAEKRIPGVRRPFKFVNT